MEIIIFILWMSAVECKQQRWWRWLNAEKTPLKAPLINCDFVLAPGVRAEAAWSGMLCWRQVSVKMWLVSVWDLSSPGQLPFISSIFLGLNIGQKQPNLACKLSPISYFSSPDAPAGLAKSADTDNLKILLLSICCTCPFLFWLPCVSSKEKIKRFKYILTKKHYYDYFIQSWLMMKTK